MRHSPKNKPVLKLFLELKRVFIGVINSSNVYVISVPENYVLVHFFKNLINYVSQAPYLLIFLMGSMRYLTSQTSTELFSNSPFPACSLSVLSYADPQHASYTDSSPLLSYTTLYDHIYIYNS